MWIILLFFAFLRILGSVLLGWLVHSFVHSKPPGRKMVCEHYLHQNLNLAFWHLGDHLFTLFIRWLQTSTCLLTSLGTSPLYSGMIVVTISALIDTSLIIHNIFWQFFFIGDDLLPSAVSNSSCTVSSAPFHSLSFLALARFLMIMLMWFDLELVW